MKRFTRASVAGALVAILGLTAVPAQAESDIGMFAGYGYLRQDRRGANAEGHLLSVGIHTGSSLLEEGLFAAFSLDFAVDYVYKDLSNIGLTWEFGYGFGSRVFGAYVGGAIRSGLDGYSGADTSDNAVSSWAPLDPGAMVGIVALLGSYGIGAELRGWLGWNFYEDSEMAIEPYFDARLFMSVLF